MKKMIGNKIRAFQGGEALGYELGVYYSNSLSFVAIKAHIDVDTGVNKSKIAGVKINNMLVLQRRFDTIDIISDGRCNEIASKWVLFHNGNLHLILDYLNLDMALSIDVRLRHLERVLIDKHKDSRAMTIKEREARANDVLERTSWAVLNLERIPIWIRRIFKAV